MFPLLRVSLGLWWSSKDDEPGQSVLATIFPIQIVKKRTQVMDTAQSQLEYSLFQTVIAREVKPALNSP